MVKVLMHRKHLMKIVVVMKMWTRRRMIMVLTMIMMKNIGVLRDTARAPKPISQKHAIPRNGVIRYHKIP